MYGMMLWTYLQTQDLQCGQTVKENLNWMFFLGYDFWNISYLQSLFLRNARSILLWGLFHNKHLNNLFWYSLTTCSIHTPKQFRNGFSCDVPSCDCAAPRYIGVRVWIYLYYTKIYPYLKSVFWSIH